MNDAAVPVDVLRAAAPPAPPTSRSKAIAWGMANMDLVFRIVRNVWPIPHYGAYAAVTRFDDVQEVLSRQDVFLNPYGEKLDVIMGGHPFFLGMTDTEAYTRDTTNMRLAMRRSDIAERLAPAVSARAETLVAASSGRIEVVDFIRTVTFDVLCDYFGTPGPDDADLRIWATRLFEFQFADPGGDPDLRREVDAIAPLLRAHIDGLLTARRAAPERRDDVLGRCLAMQDSGLPGMDDATIRTNLIGFIVGGLPQPPMVAPQALDQLLRRPAALAAAQAAAHGGDDARLAAIVFEALRFDPLAPGLMRQAATDYVVAAGTWRARTIRRGTTVLAAFRSAMQDGRRVRFPDMFDATRPAWQYMHFGYGLHTCFGIHMNQALLPLMLKPLLRRQGLRRAEGPAGQLTKRGAFADRLTVLLDA